MSRRAVPLRYARAGAKLLVHAALRQQRQSVSDPETRDVLGGIIGHTSLGMCFNRAFGKIDGDAGISRIFMARDL